MSNLSRQTSVTSSLVSNGHHNHPQKIGPWKLGKTLGRGATGRVLLATHQSTGQKAAVKVVSKSELNEDEGTQGKRADEAGLPYGIEREIIIMKLLTHPNVLRLYDVWETSKALYLVLEYVEGGELFDLLVERGPLQEIEAVKYFRQIILGTAYCHALGICHRDLKPENLLLDGSLNVKLADFGMAALEINGKLLETSCGSPHYAAPEIVSGLKYHGAASDVWSCGVILFALLTGRLPFDDENIRNLLLKVQAGNFEMPEEISHEAQDLIARMLTVNPTKRIHTERILSHPLLNKYPIPNEDLISVKSLPHPETAYKSLGSVKNIDKQILSNLSILWHDRPQQEIINCLLKNGPNPEKTFYALLMRYRHTQDDSSQMLSGRTGTQKRGMTKSGSISNRGTPRRKRASHIASRPTSFQYRNGGALRNNPARGSVASSVNNSPHKSPSKRFSYSQSPMRSPYRSPYKSPYRSPYKSPRRSPRRSPRKTTNRYEGTPPPMFPRNSYNDLVATQRSTPLNSVPPSLPSKDSITPFNVGPTNPIVNEVASENLMASAKISSPSRGGKRNSILSRSGSRNKLSRRKSIRASMTTGLKRNSITIKLLSTYAKLSGDSDWEYMDKSAKRTSATFATLCDKIFNQEQYDQDEENLIDEEEKNAREYERLMELERKKHEAELKARKELEKRKRRQKRKSLLSSKKLSILIKDDNSTNNSENEIDVTEPLNQPKRMQKPGLRSISEGARRPDDELTKEDVEKLKLRSVTQPEPRRRQTPVLTRRPVSRLDPLWAVYENQELERAKEALDQELKESRASRKKKERRTPHAVKAKNRESMISVLDEYDTKGEKQRYYDEEEFQLPAPEADDSALSDEYMSEIRKSRLLNSQLNIKGIADGSDTLDKKGKAVESKTLIADVRIPNVTRKSRCFTNSNKRLSVLTMYSTKESYQDLNNILKSGDAKQGRARTSNLRTSFADRLDKAGLPDDEDVPLDEGSIIDFDQHLASKRTSYYDSKRLSNTSRAYTFAKSSRRPISELPDLPNESDEDETFVTKNDEGYKKSRKGQYSRNALSDSEQLDVDEDVFANIKLPENQEKSNSASKQRASRASRGTKTKSMLPSAESMLIPDVNKIPNKKASKPYGSNEKKLHHSNSDESVPPPPPAHQQKLPLSDSTNKPDPQPQNRNRSIFRKLSWGTKKTLDDTVSNPVQLPSPADSRSGSVEEKPKSSFLRWFSSSSEADNISNEIKRFNTILPKHEMFTALFSLLGSWSNFGLKNLKNDQYGYNITGAITKNNVFNLKSCKFRIKINAREFGQKSEIVCARVKGSKVTTGTLFKEIEKVLRKEGVLDV